MSGAAGDRAIAFIAGGVLWAGVALLLDRLTDEAWTVVLPPAILTSTLLVVLPIGQRWSLRRIAGTRYGVAVSAAGVLAYLGLSVAFSVTVADIRVFALQVLCLAVTAAALLWISASSVGLRSLALVVSAALCGVALLVLGETLILSGDALGSTAFLLGGVGCVIFSCVPIARRYSAYVTAAIAGGSGVLVAGFSALRDGSPLAAGIFLLGVGILLLSLPMLGLMFFLLLGPVAFIALGVLVLSDEPLIGVALFLAAATCLVFVILMLTVEQLWPWKLDWFHGFAVGELLLGSTGVPLVLLCFERGLYLLGAGLGMVTILVIGDAIWLGWDISQSPGSRRRGGVLRRLHRWAIGRPSSPQ